jgi:inhibitor of KinA
MTLLAQPRLLALGDGAVTVQFGTAVSLQAHALVMGFLKALDDAVKLGQVDGVVEWVPAYASVTVRVDDASDAAATLRDAKLLALAQAAIPLTASGRSWQLPVCFDDDFAPDLAALAASRGLRSGDVVAQLLATPLRVYMLGFVPGFPFMGDLPPILNVPRLNSPRRAVPLRSVGLAVGMACIYPWVSPGGWHLVGRTPVHVFDVREAEPTLLRAGDQVRWRRVDRSTFDALEQQANDGTLSRPSMLLGAAS